MRAMFEYRWFERVERKSFIPVDLNDVAQWLDDGIDPTDVTAEHVKDYFDAGDELLAATHGEDLHDYALREEVVLPEVSS